MRDDDVRVANLTNKREKGTCGRETTCSALAIGQRYRVAEHAHDPRLAEIARGLDKPTLDEQLICFPSFSHHCAMWPQRRSVGHHHEQRSAVRRLGEEHGFVGVVQNELLRFQKEVLLAYLA